MNENDKMLIVWITPQVLEGLMREHKDYSVRCVDGVPETHKLINYGFSEARNMFYFTYATDDCPEGFIPEDFSPIIRKEFDGDDKND